MNQPTDEELIAEIEKERIEGTDLDGLVPVDATSTRERRAVFSVRLSRPEMNRISYAAEKAGLPMGEYIRQAAYEAANRDLERTSKDRASLPALHDRLRLALTELEHVMRYQMEEVQEQAMLEAQNKRRQA